MRYAALMAAAAAVTALGGCARADDEAANTDSDTLSVYASLPLQGPRRAESLATANGERLALSEVGGQVGGLTIKLVVLDDATPGAEGWDPRQAAENAKTAARDKTTIAYLGDSDSGATAVSLPILNEASIAQVSPLTTYAGLTRPDGADKGEPDRFYPQALHTFARVVPADHVQARAQLDAFERANCSQIAVVDDRGVSGRGLAANVALDAEKAGLPLLDRVSPRDDADPAGVAKDVLKPGPDCVLVAASASPQALAWLDALHAAAPRLELFAPDELADDALVSQLQPGTQSRLHLTVLAPAPEGAAGGAARDFAAAYARQFGSPPLTGSYYGYEAMKLALKAISDAGSKGNNRIAVVKALLAVRDRDSILGRYSLDRYGDTTIERYAEASVRDGQVRVLRQLRAGPVTALAAG